MALQYANGQMELRTLEIGKTAKGKARELYNFQTGLFIRACSNLISQTEKEQKYFQMAVSMKETSCWECSMDLASSSRHATSQSMWGRGGRIK